MRDIHGGRTRPIGRRVALAVAAVLALSGVFGVSPQVVAGASAAAPGPSGNASISPGQSNASLRRWWTPERMASARSLDHVGTSGDGGGAAAVASEPGAPVSVPGATGSLGAAPADDLGAGGGAAATQVPKPYTNLPDRTNGKVFFRMRGGTFVCSGTLVNNPRQNLVVTAGHCVHSGERGTWHTDWVFVPAYDGTAASGSQAPYGTFGAWRLATRQSWIDSSNHRQDIGIAILNNQSNGQPLGARIGGQGIRFNQSTSQTWTDFGYPASPPFNGQTQWQCVSTLKGRDSAIPGAGPDPLRIERNMTGGSSGGGWLISIGSDGLGFVNSVNSYGYPNFDPGYEYGPYFGSEAQALYDANKDLGPGSK
jgi:hypothetical protein